MKDAVNGTKVNINLAGRLLIAHPCTDEEMYQNAVILVLNTHRDYVTGIQLNKVMPELFLSEVCHKLDIDYAEPAGIYRGGNRGVQRVNIVHSSDWSGITTERITDQLSITRDISVLAALSRGEGPTEFRACAGYWNISNFSLDDTWIHIDASPELVFLEQSQWSHCVQDYVRGCVDQSLLVSLGV